MTEENKKYLEQGNDLLIAKISNQIPTEKDPKIRDQMKGMLKKAIIAGEALRSVLTDEEISTESKQESEELKKVEDVVK